MAAASEYRLIADAVEFTLGHAEDVEREVLEALETSGATRHVNALRMLGMQSAIVAIGALQAFEGLLQQKQGWKDTFQELDRTLRSTGHGVLADRFIDYRDAVNVLKHGQGRSYDRLLDRKDALPFVVKGRDERFFDEGDVSEGIRLVQVDHAFVRQVSDIVQEAVEALRSARSGA